MSTPPWIDQVKSKPIVDVARELDLKTGRAGSFACPSCGAERRSKGDQRMACGATGDRRGWRCHRCDAGGDAIDLVAIVQNGVGSSRDLTKSQLNEIRGWCANRGWCTEPGGHAALVSTSRLARRKYGRSRPPTADSVEPEESEEPEADPGGPFSWRDGLAEECEERLWAAEGRPVLEYLTEGRALTEETIRHWNLGCHVVDGRGGPEYWLSIPLQNHAGKIVTIRFRSVPPADKTYRVCPARPLPLYGSHQLGNDLTGSVIVTEGELDVVAMWQYGYQVSVVSGTAGAGAWKEEWLDELEPYEHFTLLYDDDVAGNKGADKFAMKMGKDRCSRGVLPFKDAGECLVQGIDVGGIERSIDYARPMFGVELRRIGSYTDEVGRQIANPDELIGRQTSSEKLNRALAGLRPGLMVITGDTATGKSTFATWLMWDQALQGVPGVITSFENQPITGVMKLLRMQLGGDFTKVDDPVWRAAMGELGQLPLDMVHHYGHMEPETLFSTIRYAARRKGAKMFLVDHLGFLINHEVEDERREIERIIRELAIIGVVLGILVMLVAHPKSVDLRRGRITMGDLKGASSIKQDAHEVLVLEIVDPTDKRRFPATRIHCDKVRSDFGVNRSNVLLAFGPISCCYADTWGELPESQISPN